MDGYDKKVTIGIPVYNEIRFIERTLRTALGQAEEILISDNASTDGTSEICQKYAAMCPEIRYVRHEENKGALFNCNYVLDNASHDYFMWLGGHDLMPDNHVAKLRAILDAEKDVSLAYANPVHLTHEYVFINTYVYNYAATLLSPDASERVLCIIRDLYDCTMYYGLYRRSILMHAMHDFYNEKYLGIDHGLLAEIANKGKIKLCPETVYYRIEPRTTDVDRNAQWSRVLRMIYSDKYNQSIHIPEMIPIGIIYVQLRTAKNAAMHREDSDAYIATVKKILMQRWGVNDLVRTYLARHVGMS